MDFQTHPAICTYMVGLLPRGVSTVLEPTPGKGNLVKALEQGGYRVIAPFNFWDLDHLQQWDAVVMNPPFSPMAEGYRILYSVMGMTDIVIALMPYLTIINSEQRTHDIRTFGLRSVTHLPRSAFPGARVQTCILSMQRGYAGETVMPFFEPEWLK